MTSERNIKVVKAIDRLGGNPETQGTASINSTLHIGCKKCGGNAGQIVDGALIYTVKHSGEHHTIRIDLEWLKNVLTAAKL